MLPALLRAKSSCRSIEERSKSQSSAKGIDGSSRTGSDIGSLDAPSENEIGEHHEESSASSWGSSQGGFDHYDTWEVIKDEYAEDFGFNVATDNENQILPCTSDDTRGMFKIIGTSAEDIRSVPHVLSPPLMESLLNFVPERLSK